MTVNGKLVSFIELGVGFNPELTGRENVFLNGAMLGFSPEEIGEMYDEIVEFAELSEFMNQKLKNYSSGMQVRLAFSVAIKAHGDVLVLMKYLLLVMKLSNVNVMIILLSEKNLDKRQFLLPTT